MEQDKLASPPHDEVSRQVSGETPREEHPGLNNDENLPGEGNIPGALENVVNNGKLEFFFKLINFKIF